MAWEDDVEAEGRQAVVEGNTTTLTGVPWRGRHMAGYDKRHRKKGDVIGGDE
jgi:hypothetical protein